MCGLRAFPYYTQGFLRQAATLLHAFARAGKQTHADMVLVMKRGGNPSSACNEHSVKLSLSVEKGPDGHIKINALPGRCVRSTLDSVRCNPRTRFPGG